MAAPTPNAALTTGGTKARRHAQTGRSSDDEAGRAQNRPRCAVYTRVSTNSGLEQDFNSLHAQREACEAYIKSQAHEGWQLVRDRYDDGGFSGGTMERPALQQLLADVQAGKIDVMVVYKVDRLTRSLADFAKMVELFDAHGVSFVSVTQPFNTTTSMGRLTLNVLLSFAQFEREVTGERIRDKIAASKRKGIWMGGAVPLGYRVENRALQWPKTKLNSCATFFAATSKSAAWCASRPPSMPRMLARPFGRAEPAERPAALRSREAISIGSYRTRHGRQQPHQPRMLRHGGLRKQDAFFRIDPGGDIGGGNFTRRISQPFILIGQRDGVQVNNAERHRLVLLQRNPVLQRPEIIPKVKAIGGLHTGEDTAFHAFMLSRGARSFPAAPDRQVCPPAARHRPSAATDCRRSRSDR